MRRPPGQLIAGVAIVGGMVLASVAAPLLTTHDPLREWHFRWFGDRYLPAPFAPSDLYPLGSDQLGRDIWSNLLYGARLTLGIAFVVLVARLVAGVALGAIAGWFPGRWPDRVVSLLIDAFSAFPTLLFAMLWILAFDIRAGASSFVLALAITGWWAFGRTMRSALVALRGSAYLEAARSLGLSDFMVLTRHVMPNVLPLLAVTAALETSAVLLALGELGFLGFVVGGGQSVFVNDTGSARNLFFGAPEWGGLIAQGRFQFLRNPWIAIFPAATFALAILGFNLLGHGLRTVLERSPIGLAWLFRWRVAAAAAAVVLVVQVVLPRLGPAAELAPIAATFDAERARTHVAYLADPARQGRRTGSAGYRDAAAYVAERFREIGLEPLGDDRTYFQRVPVGLVDLAAMPVLELVGPQREAFRPRDDFSELVGGRAGPGTAEAALVFAGPGIHSREYSDYRDVDPAGKVVMVLPGFGSPQELIDNALRVRAAGVILVADPGVERLLRYSYFPGFEREALPTVTVTERVADRLLASSGQRIADLRDAMEKVVRGLDFPSGRAIALRSVSFETPARVRLSVPIGEVRTVEGVNVVGFLPAAISSDRDRYLIIGGHLDGIGMDPDGSIFPAANDNASGPSLLIEVARVVASQRDRLRAGVLFVAFCGEEEGLRGSEGFLQASLSTPYRPENVGAFINLDVAGCCGELLGATDESFGLHARLDGAAERHGIRFGYVARGSSDHLTYARRGVPAVMLAWTDFGAVHRVEDTAATIDVAHLRAAGVVASQAVLELAAIE